MSSFGYPKRKDYQKTGRTGEVFVEYFVTKELGWIFRPVHREDDFGIDGYIDLVENDNVNGKSLSIQVKCGNSYFRKRTSGGFKYEGSKQHLNLYLNLGLPVILVLVRDDCEEAYWVEFKVEQTSQTGSGWWIEIPKNNRLTKETGLEWKSIAGPTYDYSQEIENFWAVSEAIKDANLLAVAIPKDEVEALSMHTISLFIERLSKNMDLLLSKRNSVEIFFPDYDADDRELHQIPEFRRWMVASIDAGIPWFYFLNTLGPSSSLGVLYGCGCEVSVVKKTEEGHYLSTTVEDRKKWLEANFQNLNLFTELNGIEVNINKEVSERVMSKYFEMMNRAENELS